MSSLTKRFPAYVEAALFGARACRKSRADRLGTPSPWRCRKSVQNDAPRWKNLRKIVEITDVSGQHARTQSLCLQEDQGIVDKAALVALALRQLAQPEQQAGNDAGLPPDRCVGSMKSVRRYVIYRLLDNFQNRLR